MQNGNFNFHNGNPHPYGNPQNDFPRRRRRKSKFFFGLLIGMIILALAFIVSVALAYKFYATSQKVIDSKQPASFMQTIKDIASPDRKSLQGEQFGRINILLVGLAGKNYPGANLTDSIIVASINPKTWQTALLSIPRDLYVPIPDTNSSTKINALYARSQDKDKSGKSLPAPLRGAMQAGGSKGIADLKQVIEDITGQPIDYYISLDFDGFKQIINELGGIKVQVPKDLHDERYPGPHYSYETFDLKQGLQTLDGETALKFARTRHDEDGDFGRAYRQQLILESARSKAFSLGTILNIPEISRLLDTLGEHLRTNIQLDELNSFLDIVQKIDTHTTINKVLDAGQPNSVMAVSHVSLGGVRAFVLIPRTGKYDEIQDISKNIFDLELLSRKKAAVKIEDASVTILNSSGAKGFDAKLKTLLDKFGYQTSISVCRDAKSCVSTGSDTTIYDLTGGIKPFSLEDISKKLGAKISVYMPDSLSAQCQGADFCLVAGKDITDKLNYEENSVEDLENGYDHQQVNEKTYFNLLKRGSSQKF